MKRHKFILLVTGSGILILAGVFIAGLVLASQVGRRPVVGSPAPDFEMALYPDYRAGLPEKIRLSDLRGKVVILNFWASWCVECKKEAPDLEATYRRFKERDVVLLGVDYLDTEAAALQYLREFDTTYPNGVDMQQRIARAYHITGVPETFIIDKNGTVREVIPQRTTEAHLASMIETLLAE
ncbi:MAG: TlpA family protein disulfide reductase [Chloroflexi bacterium]|nr:TlpA family protein disulfide reductase [Chloroflexota bacterium]